MARPKLEPRATSGGSYFTSAKTSLSFINSGATLLDCVLGGGWPLGRVVNVVGDKATGKTLVAIEACANFSQQYANGKIWYDEIESAFDKSYAAALGMPLDRVKFIEGHESVEDLFEKLDRLLEAKEKKGDTSPGLFIVDSLD